MLEYFLYFIPQLFSFVMYVYIYRHTPRWSLRIKLKITFNILCISISFEGESHQTCKSIPQELECVRESDRDSRRSLCKKIFSRSVVIQSSRQWWWDIHSRWIFRLELGRNLISFKLLKFSCKNSYTPTYKVDMMTFFLVNRHRCFGLTVVP